MQLILKKKSSILLIIMIIAIALENFKLINILGAPIKLTHLVFIVAIINSLYMRIVKKQFNLKHLTILLFFLILPLLPLYRVVNTTEFLKTYVIYIIMISFMSFSYLDFSKKINATYKIYIYLFLWVILLVQLLGIIQFVCMNYFGYFFLEGIWGDFQFHTSIYGMQFGMYRAYSIFHEPSFFGWISTTSFAICIYLKRKFYLINPKYYLFQCFNVIAVGVSLSASAQLILLLIYGVLLLLEMKKPVKFFLLTIISCAALFILWKFTNVFDSLERIENEINTSETSGYERLNTPVQYMIATFENYPIFGRGLGQEGNIDAVGVIGLYEGVHNSLFGIFVNLGLSAIILIVYFFQLFFKKIKNNTEYLLLILALMGIYVSTGAYLSLDTFVVLVFILLIGDLPKKGIPSLNYKDNSTIEI